MRRDCSTPDQVRVEQQIWPSCSWVTAQGVSGHATHSNRHGCHSSTPFSCWHACTVMELRWSDSGAPCGQRLPGFNKRPFGAGRGRQQFAECMRMAPTSLLGAFLSWLVLTHSRGPDQQKKVLPREPGGLRARLALQNVSYRRRVSLDLPLLGWCACVVRSPPRSDQCTGCCTRRCLIRPRGASGIA
jgi:hypothetical protein